MSGFPPGLQELLPASTIATWTGIFEGTKVQFLEATTQHQLDPTIPTAGVEVAGLRDLFAMKLKVIADRGELRDYFDLLTPERRTDLRAETILPLFVERYRPRIPRSARPYTTSSSSSRKTFSL